MDKNSYMLGGMKLLTHSTETQINNRSWTLVYIRQGIGMYILDSNLRPINQGDIIILPPKTSYSFLATDLGDEYNINIDAIVFRFDNVWLTNLLAVFTTMGETVLRLREMNAPYAVEGPKWMKLSALMSHLSTVTESKKPVLILEILDLISSSKDMIQILPSSPSQELTLTEKKERIERYISTNLLNKISLEDVSAYIGMNRTYFCLFFKKHYGKGFSDYLNDQRVEKAALLLLDERRSIADVARECGFKTVSYFNRAFKRSKGVTPGEHRKRCQSL